MMQQKIFKRLTAAFIAASITLTGGVTALAQAKPEGKSINFPVYFQQVLDRREVEVDCVAKRDDLGIELPGAPVDVTRYVKLLTSLNLKTTPKGGNLAVKAPFTLRFTHAKKTDVFAFTTQGVQYGGALYLPENPSALTAFYADDWQKFFSEEYYPLGRDMTITTEQAATVTLRRNHYTDDITMRLTAQATIKDLLAAQKAILVRKTASVSDVPISTGGSVNETLYTLRNGTITRLFDGGGSITLQTGTQKEQTYQILRGADGRAVFDALLDSYKGVPQMTAALGGKQPEQIYQAAFQYGSETKSYQNDIPLEYGFDSRIYLPIRADNTAKLTFSETPSQVTAQIFPLETGKKDALRSVTVGKGGTLALPNDPGDYGMNIHAVFPKGTVDYFLGFAVSDLPEFFDSISYGNDEGNVTVTRDDLGVTVIAGQNRQYVQFLQDLDLIPAAGGLTFPASQIKQPFTLTFSCEGYPNQMFSFSDKDSKILYNGKPYQAQNYKAFQRLYAPYDPMKGETLADDTKGFLAVEFTTFGKLYPLLLKDISTIKVEQLHMYQRSVSVDDQGKTTYGFKLDTLSSQELKPAEFADALKKVNALHIAKEEQNADSYDYGKYTAYTLVTKDGRTFSLNRRLTVDGKASGYYLPANG